MILLIIFYEIVYFQVIEYYLVKLLFLTKNLTLSINIKILYAIVVYLSNRVFYFSFRQRKKLLYLDKILG